MIFSYRNAEKTIVALNDLIKINNDRIACYTQALNDENNIDMDLRRIFKEIIEESNGFRQQLISKIKQLDRNPKNNLTISGILHRAWMDLKVTLIGNTRSAIINFCLYNEEIVQHTYKAALKMADKMGSDIPDIIETQLRLLKQSCSLIRNHREAHPYTDTRMVYFS